MADCSDSQLSTTANFMSIVTFAAALSASTLFWANFINNIDARMKESYWNLREAKDRLDKYPISPEGRIGEQLTDDVESVKTAVEKFTKMLGVHEETIRTRSTEFDEPYRLTAFFKKWRRRIWFWRVEEKLVAALQRAKRAGKSNERQSQISYKNGVIENWKKYGESEVKQENQSKETCYALALLNVTTLRNYNNLEECLLSVVEDVVEIRRTNGFREAPYRGSAELSLQRVRERSRSRSPVRRQSVQATVRKIPPAKKEEGAQAEGNPESHSAPKTGELLDMLEKERLRNLENLKVWEKLRATREQYIKNDSRSGRDVRFRTEDNDDEDRVIYHYGLSDRYEPSYRFGPSDRYGTADRVDTSERHHGEYRRPTVSTSYDYPSYGVPRSGQSNRREEVLLRGETRHRETVQYPSERERSADAERRIRKRIEEEQRRNEETRDVRGRPPRPYESGKAREGSETREGGDKEGAKPTQVEGKGGDARPSAGPGPAMHYYYRPPQLLATTVEPSPPSPNPSPPPVRRARPSRSPSPTYRRARTR